MQVTSPRLAPRWHSGEPRRRHKGTYETLHMEAAPRMGCELEGSRKLHWHDGGRGLPLCCRTCLPLSALCSHQHQVPHTKCWSWVQWEAVGARTSVPDHGGHGTQARLACGTGTGMIQSSINDLHLPAPRVAQDLFHHLEKSIYCQ